jgi:hypothetical protein
MIVTFSIVVLQLNNAATRVFAGADKSANADLHGFFYRKMKLGSLEVCQYDVTVA